MDFLTSVIGAIHKYNNTKLIIEIYEKKVSSL